MKFKRWLFFRKIKHIALHIYHDHHFASLRSTIVYNLLKAFILVIAILGIIFRIAPRSAHVSYVADTIEAVGNITADHIKMNLMTNKFSVSCNEAIVLYCLGSRGIVTDNTTYEEPCKVIFEPFSPDLGGEIFSRDLTRVTCNLK